MQSTIARCPDSQLPRILDSAIPEELVSDLIVDLEFRGGGEDWTTDLAVIVSEAGANLFAPGEVAP